MGQYYRVYLKDVDGKEIVLNRNVDGQYTFAKIMEHSWWKNNFVGTVCNMLYQNPHKIAWVGDYANDFEKYDLVWPRDEDKDVSIGVTERILLLDNKYIVNHTTKEYLDCNEYKKNSVDLTDPNWIIHPLSLLTAIGNGQGGGDYFGLNSDEVGIWCNNEISIEHACPDGYKKYSVIFRE